MLRSTRPRSLFLSEIAMRLLATISVGMVLLSLTGGAQAQYITYRDWEQAGSATKAVHLAATVDALLHFAQVLNRPDITDHFLACLRREKLNVEELGERFQGYLGKNPNTRNASVQSLVVSFMGDMCGAVPQR